MQLYDKKQCQASPFLMTFVREEFLRWRIGEGAWLDVVRG
jgi:hypothetical protein